MEDHNHTHEHHRDHESSKTEHRRASDDVIIELLRLVQEMDTKLSVHMREEAEQFERLVKENTDSLIEIFAKGYPKDDIELHREAHDSIWVAIKHWISRK